MKMINTRELRWLFYVCKYICWDLKIYMSLKQSIWGTNKILKEIAVLECEKAKLFKLVPSAHSHIHKFVSVLVFCRYRPYNYILYVTLWYRYTVVYSAIPKGNCIDCICMQMYFETWIYVFETKYLKYQQNIEGNSSFRVWKCEKKNLCSLIPLSRIFTDFSQC